MSSVPIGPSGFYLPWVHHFPSASPVCSPTLPPSTCLPAPLSVLSSFSSQDYSYPVIMSVGYRLSRPCATPYLGVYWCFLMLGLLLLGVLLRSGERPGRLHSLSIDRPSSLPHTTQTFWHRSVRPDPPPSPPCLIDPVLIS